MTQTTRSRPSAYTASELIQDGLDTGRVLSIVGRCTVDYEGRTQSTLVPGEHIVLCKPDGTLLVHYPTDYTSVTWQPSRGTHDVALVDDSGRISTRLIDAVVELVPPVNTPDFE